MPNSRKNFHQRLMRIGKNILYASTFDDFGKNMKQLEWLYLQVKSMKETIITFGNTGSTMTNLSKGKFQKLKLIMPTNDLIDEFSSIVKPLLEQEINYLKQNELLSKQRDSLLPRLMSGKLSMEGKEII